MMLTNITRVFALAAWILVFLAGVIQASQEATGTVSASLTDIRVSFKLDPRITRGMYMGDRWVSPPIYTGVQVGKEFTVEAIAQGLDAKGEPMDINPEWIPANPGMVAVSPGQGQQVKITVRRAGQSKLKVVSMGFSKKLFIKATYKDNAMQVEISQ